MRAAGKRKLPSPSTALTTAAKRRAVVNADGEVTHVSEEQTPSPTTSPAVMTTPNAVSISASARNDAPTFPDQKRLEEENAKLHAELSEEKVAALRFKEMLRDESIRAIAIWDLRLKEVEAEKDRLANELKQAQGDKISLTNQLKHAIEARDELRSLFIVPSPMASGLGADESGDTAVMLRALLPLSPTAAAKAESPASLARQREPSLLLSPGSSSAMVFGASVSAGAAPVANPLPDSDVAMSDAPKLALKGK